ncbi:MAG: NUDIX hydrolase [Clostridia bacterium]|nr:NUDIX hydrolase [Clostridia bacterium]
MKYNEETVDSRVIYDGRIIHVKEDTVRLCNGNLAKRELVEHPGGVGIVAYTEEGSIIFVRQFRKPYDEEILEIPAGKLERGEDHDVCGRRELEEETGYRAQRFDYLGGFYPTPGYCGEIIHIYYADGLTMGERHPDPDEFVDVLTFSPQQVEQMIGSGEIKDMKTIVGYFLSKAKRQQG